MFRFIVTLAVLLVFASSGIAGTNLLDASGNVTFTDVQSLGVATAVSGDTNTITIRGQATAEVQVTANATTLQFEGTVAGGTFFAIPCLVATTGTGVTVTSTGTTGQWACPTAGLQTFRLRQSAAGTSTSSIIASQGSVVGFDTIQGLAIASTTAGSLGQLVMGAVTTAPPAYVTAQSDPLSLSVPGGLRVGEPQNTASAGLPAPLVMGAVTTAAPAYSTANASALSLTLGGGLRTDMSSQGSTAITSVPVAAGTGTLTGNAPVVNAANYVGTTAAVASSAGVMKVGIAGGAAGAAIDAANNGTAPANVLVAGAQLQSSASATVGTAGQVGNVVAGLDHVLYTRPGGPVLFNCSSNGVGTTIVVCQAAPGAGLFNYIGSIVAQSSTSTAGQFTVTAGTGAACVTTNVLLFSGTTAVTLTAPPNTLTASVMTFPVPIKTPSAAQQICVTGVITNTTNITITGFVAP